jgi:hypothetical protein
MAAFAESKAFMSSEALRSLFVDSRQHYLLLDSNLLLLLITAKYDMRLLATFKRVQMFSQDDAILLAWIVDQFKAVVTTTHVVTEVSNLGNSLSSKSRSGWFSVLSEFSSQTYEETHSLKSLTVYEQFIRFGVTDCALSILADKYRVLTMDRPISNYATSTGKTLLNFDDLRRMI